MAVDTSISIDSIAPVDTFEGPLAASDRWRTSSPEPVRCRNHRRPHRNADGDARRLLLHRHRSAANAVAALQRHPRRAADRIRHGRVPTSPVSPSTWSTPSSSRCSTPSSSMDASRFPRTVGGDIGKGIIYGLILGLISMGFLVPYVSPEAGVRLLQLLHTERVEAPAVDRALAPDVRLLGGNVVQPDPRQADPSVLTFLSDTGCCWSGRPRANASTSRGHPLRDHRDLLGVVRVDSELRGEGRSGRLCRATGSSRGRRPRGRASHPDSTRHVSMPVCTSALTFRARGCGGTASA